jgi:AmiR/NasT family two-component response regulator
MEPKGAQPPKLKVIIIEDEPNMRLFLREIVEKQLGHEVIAEAETGPDMIQMVLTHEPDVVLFDIHLPEMDGLEALRKIYETKVVAAVAITGDRDQSLVARAMDEQVLAFLIKPIEAHQLGPALQVAWARFEELSTLTQENASLRTTLENRKVIERAKGVLMKRYRWSEADAFRRLQRSAMNRRVSMVELATAILNGTEVDLS